MTALKDLDPYASAPAFFGSELRRLRMSAGMTQAELGKEVSYTASLVGLVESARRRPTRDFAERSDALLGGGGLLVRLWDLAIRSNAPRVKDDIAEVESGATEIRSFDALMVPQLLQTEDYARSVLAARGDFADRDAVDRAVKARRERQSAIASGTRCWFVLDDAVLRRQVGGPAVLRDQLAYLAEIATVSNVVVQVVPPDTPAYPGLEGALTVLSFAEAADVAYVDSHGLFMIEPPDLVAACCSAFDLIRAVALSPQRSRDLITAELRALG